MRQFHIRSGVGGHILAYTGFGGSGGGFFNAAARWRMYSK